MKNENYIELDDYIHIKINDFMTEFKNIIGKNIFAKTKTQKGYFLFLEFCHLEKAVSLQDVGWDVARFLITSTLPVSVSFLCFHKLRIFLILSILSWIESL